MLQLTHFIVSQLRMAQVIKVLTSKLIGQGLMLMVMKVVQDLHKLLGFKFPLFTIILLKKPMFLLTELKIMVMIYNKQEQRQ